MSGPQEAWAKRSGELATHAMSTICSRTDCYIERPMTGGKWRTVHEPLTSTVLSQHFAGDLAVGGYMASEDRTCRALAFDIDAHDGDQNRAWQQASAVVEVLGDLSLPFTLEDSDGKGSTHVWVPMAGLFPGEQVIELGKRVVAIAGIQCEVFPKGLPNAASPCGGNALRLPGLHPDTGHWSRFRIGDNWLAGDQAIDAWLATPGVTIQQLSTVLGRSAHKRTQETQETQEAHKNTQAHTRTDLSNPLSSYVNCLIEAAIQATLPEVVGERNKKLFGLARRLKGIEELPSEHLKSLKPIVRDWHQRALPAISTRPFDETWADFIGGWPKVKEIHPMIIERAWIEAAPRVRSGEQLCDAYDSVAAKGLLVLCEVLSKREGNQIFYLSCRDAGRVAGVSHKQAANILNMFVADGVLVLEQKGSPSGQASRYQFAEACSTCAEDK